MNYENYANYSKMKSLGVFNDIDEKTLEWIHGGQKDYLDLNVKLSENDIVFLLDLMVRYLFNLLSGMYLLGTCRMGDEQPLTWRWINLIFIKSGALSREEVKEKLIRECEVFGFEDEPELLSLFDRYIV